MTRKRDTQVTREQLIAFLAGGDPVEVVNSRDELLEALKPRSDVQETQ